MFLILLFSWSVRLGVIVADEIKPNNAIVSVGSFIFLGI